MWLLFSFTLQFHTSSLAVFTHCINLCFLTWLSFLLGFTGSQILDVCSIFTFPSSFIYTSVSVNCTAMISLFIFLWFCPSENCWRAWSRRAQMYRCFVKNTKNKTKTFKYHRTIRQKRRFAIVLHLYTGEYSETTSYICVYSNWKQAIINPGDRSD